MSVDWESAYKSIEPSDKSKEIASEKIFGWQPFTAEQVEKQRHKVGIGLKGVATGLLGSLGDLSEYAQGIVGVKSPKKILPNSKDIGDLFEKAAGEKFNPNTTGEEILEGSTSALGSILGLGGPIKGGTLAKTIARNALGAFVPAAVAATTKKENLPPWLQVASTIGSSFLVHRLTGKSLRDMESALYKKADSLLPQAASIDATNLEKKINSLRSTLSKGLEAPSEKAVMNTIDKLKNKIVDGEMGIQELVSSRRSLMETIITDELKKSPRARSLVKGMVKDIDKTIEDYGKINPEYVKTYREANSLHRGIHESTSVIRYIKKHFPGIGAAELFTHYVSPFIAKAALPAAQIATFSTALAKNPGFRKAYLNVLKNASNEEFKGTLGALKKFQHEASKSGLESDSKPDWEQAFNNLDL